MKHLLAYCVIMTLTGIIGLLILAYPAQQAYREAQDQYLKDPDLPGRSLLRGGYLAIVAVASIAIMVALMFAIRLLP